MDMIMMKMYEHGWMLKEMHIRDEEQIKLLNQIGMKWFSENINMKLQKKK